jgi:hypothetical protein
VATAIVNVLAGVLTVIATWALARFVLKPGLSEGTASGSGVGDEREAGPSESPSFAAVGALLAAGLVAVDPLLVRYAAQPMTECVFAALVSAALWPLAIVLRSPDRWSVGFLAGVLLGLAALCRPTIWPFVVAALAIVAPRSQASFRRFVLMLAGLLLTVLPWGIRNACVLGQWRITTTHGGYTLLLANNPVFYHEVARQPWGAVWSGESLEAWQRAMFAEIETDLGPSPGELATDRWQTARARKSIQDDPAGFAAAAWYRIRSFWSLSPRGAAAGRWRWPIAVWYVGMFAAAAVGVWRLARRDVRSLLPLLLLLVVSIQAVHLVYWTDTRMRAPLHPVFAVLSVAAIPGRRRQSRIGG